LTDTHETLWKVDFTGKARKQKEKLPQSIAAALFALHNELIAEGPERTN